MIRLHRHSDAGALMGADSPDTELLTTLPAVDAERLSPPPTCPPLPPMAVVLSPSCEGTVSEGADSEVEES